jgi:hypothetical protein
LKSNFDKNLQEQLRLHTGDFYESVGDNYNDHLMMMGYNIAGANTQNIFDQSSLYRQEQDSNELLRA